MRLGDLDALKEAFDWRCYKSWDGALTFDQIKEVIDKSPTVKAYTEEEVQEIREDVVKEFITISERPKGEWADHNTCPFCNHTYDWEYNFCPNCGADLRGDPE